ncbi:MAG: CHAD domain-containing protein [Rhodospirillaceae bacterium]|nr:CHAD domain-containing protein [Rhodospirillaceae bacterium]
MDLNGHVLRSAQRLGPDTSVDEAMALVFRAAQEQWLKAVPAACTPRNAEGIHQLRVSLRRLRSGLSLLRRHIPQSQRRALDAELKWLLDALGPARDLDVFQHELLMPLSNKKSTKHLQVLIPAVAAARAAAQRKALAALTSNRHRKLLDDVAVWVETRRWRSGRVIKAPLAKPIGPVVRKLLNKQLGKALKQTGRIKKLSVEDLHDLHIDLKRIRYGIGHFKTALPKRTQKLARILTGLQDQLGHLNDAANVAEIAARLAKTASTARDRQRILSAGEKLAAYYSKTAADAWPDIKPRCKALRKFEAI